MQVIEVTAELAIEIHEAEEGGYWGRFPDLPGCVSQGETQEELIANLKVAAKLCLAPRPPIAPASAGRKASRAAVKRGKKVESTPRNPEGVA